MTRRITRVDRLRLTAGLGIEAAATAGLVFGIAWLPPGRTAVLVAALFGYGCLMAAGFRLVLDAMPGSPRDDLPTDPTEPDDDADDDADQDTDQDTEPDPTEGDTRP